MLLCVREDVDFDGGCGVLGGVGRRGEQVDVAALGDQDEAAGVAGLGNGDWDPVMGLQGCGAQGLGEKDGCGCGLVVGARARTSSWRVKDTVTMSQYPDLQVRHTCPKQC